MKEIPSKLVGAVLALALSASNPLWSQPNDEINAYTQFNFTSPGARSLALGGAFIALADDATAAFTNPSGLVSLSRPEVSIEGRSSDYTHTFANGGRDPDISFGESDNGTEGLSFLSFVYPGKR
jgi:long-chain fatty acid transport protein